MAAVITNVAGTETLELDANGAALVRNSKSDGNPLDIVSGTKQSVSGTQAAIPIGGWNDGNFRAIRTDRSGSIGTSLFNLLFHEPVEGATLNTQAWTSTVTTFTVTQTATGINLGANASVAANAVAVLNTQKQFTKTQKSALSCRFRARISKVTNSVIELGFGLPATTTAHTNGAYWQFTSGGALQPVLTYNSVDITGDDVSGLINMANYYTFDIVCDDNEVHYTIQDSSTGETISEQTLAVPLGQSRLWAVTHLPVFGRVFNGAIAPVSAPTFLITDVIVFSLDSFYNKAWPHTMASMAKNALISPTAFTQAAQFANSAAPASATLSNTAAGYSTLGGIYQFAAVGGAATDYSLFSFPVPSPYQFVMTGITIDCWNTGAAVATTPTLLVWGVGTNGASANISTGGHIRHGIGSQSLPVAAAIGATTTQISRQFITPIVCEAGRHLTVILRMPIGTATASQVIAGWVNIEGYFE